jgi:hypothetical protein
MDKIPDHQGKGEDERDDDYMDQERRVLVSSHLLSVFSDQLVAGRYAEADVRILTAKAPAIVPDRRRLYEDNSTPADLLHIEGAPIRVVR